MNQNTLLPLGQHFKQFIYSQMQCKGYESPTDVIIAGLKLLEENEVKLKSLQDALNAGLQCGEPRPFDSEAFLRRMHAQYG